MVFNLLIITTQIKGDVLGLRFMSNIHITEGQSVPHERCLGGQPARASFMLPDVRRLETG